MTRTCFVTLIFSFLLVISSFHPNPAVAKWVKAESDHFEIYGEVDAADLRERARELEAFHWLLLRLTNNQDKEEFTKVKIFLLKNIAKVSSVTGGAAGIYRLHQSEPIAISSAKGHFFNKFFTADNILKHEYAHHFMLFYSPAAYHPWYVEGWAELVANSQVENETQISFGRPANDRANELNTIEWLSSNNLFVDPPWELRDRVRWRFYGQSWLMAHYLTFHPQRKHELAAYLNALNSGASFEDARSVFKPDMFALDEEVKQYLKKGEFPYILFDLPEDLNLQVTITALPEAEQEMIPLRIEATRWRTDLRKRAFAQKVEESASKFPENFFAQRLLFYSQINAAQLEDALATAERLLKIDDSDSFANYAKSRVLLAQAAAIKEDKEKKKSLALAGRKWAIKSNRANPESYLPLEAFFDSFELVEDKIPEIATDGLVKAHNLMPLDSDLRFKLAKHLEKRNRLDEAKRTILPLVWAPHNRGHHAKAKKLLEKIEARMVGEKSENPDEKIHTTTAS